MYLHLLCSIHIGVQYFAIFSILGIPGSVSLSCKLRLGRAALLTVAAALFLFMLHVREAFLHVHVYSDSLFF